MQLAMANAESAQLTLTEASKHHKFKSRWLDVSFSGHISELVKTQQLNDKHARHSHQIVHNIKKIILNCNSPLMNVSWRIIY